MVLAILEKELRRRRAGRTFSARSLERLLEGQAKADRKQGLAPVPSGDAGARCRSAAGGSSCSSRNRRRTRLPWPFALRRSPAAAQAPGQAGCGCSRALFGQPLAAVCGEEGTLPRPIQELLAVLQQEGPSTEGIFRQAASVTALRELREALDHGAEVELGRQPALLLAILLKDFLRSIPSKLLVNDLYEDWMAAMRRTSKEEKMAELKAVAEKLPAANVLLLKRLLSLLRRIDRSAGTSRMSSSNLAICMGPSLLSPPHEDLLPLEAMLEATEKVKVLVEFLVENCRELFGEETAELCCPAAEESPAPRQSSRGPRLAEQSVPAVRAEPERQADASPRTPASLELGVLREAGGDTVVGSDAGEAPPALPPSTPESAADSPGRPEELASLSRERREALSEAEAVLSADVQLSRGRERSARRLLLLQEELVVAKLQGGTSLRPQLRLALEQLWVLSGRKEAAGEEEEEEQEGSGVDRSSLVFVWPSGSCIATFGRVVLHGASSCPVSLPMGQGCAGARLCPRAGGQRGLTLFLLLSVCSSRALKELWLGTLLGAPEGATKVRVTRLPSLQVLEKELRRRRAGRTFSARSLERLLEGQAKADRKQGLAPVPSGDAGARCRSAAGGSSCSSRNRRRTRLPWPFALRRSPAAAQAPGQAGCGCSRALFGQPLAAVCGEEGTLPRPIQELLAVLQQEGPSTEGIFRQAASVTALRELREALDHGAEVELGRQPALLLAILLKDFLRSIPSKLLVNNLYEDWMAAMRRTSKEEKMAELKAVAEKLPAANVLLLKRLLSLLRRIDRSAGTSRMSSSNLAICMGPSLLSPPHEDLLPLEAMLEATEKVKVLVEFLVENCRELFGEETAELCCPAAEESPAPRQSSRGPRLAEQSVPAVRAEPERQADASPRTPASLELGVLREAGGDTVVGSDAGEAPPALPPSTPESAADSPGRPEELASLSRERRNELGCVYIKPDLLPIPFYMVWILNNGLNVGWLFLWDREYLIPALVFLAALTLTTCAALFISHRVLSIHSSWLVKGHKAELWLIRILVQNGLALYATWTTIATLLNFAVVLIYKWNVSNKTATTASLSILTLHLVIWFYLENFFLDKYVRYTLTIYPVVIIALTGSAFVLLAITCLIFAVRLGLVMWRHCKRPLEAAETLDPSGTVA
ncbi:T-cell activation Rho GTPase-activating protein-like [Grus japonensis]|uniref:T-cell activation Rho GTPase-activating protein-like n=1 Tax=Grus japonensis TaxID=30415 RepID=A0ABC9WQV9_GRUJA